MPTYDASITRAEAAALIPEDAAKTILQAIPEQSAVMRVAKQLPNMSRVQYRMPVVSSLPTAYFVSGDTGLKQTTDVNWANKYIDAEELAVIVPIPEAVLDDSGFPIWDQVRPMLVEAFGLAIDQAVLFGTNIPASWTTNLGAAGLLARATAASQVVSLAAKTDLYEALLAEDGVVGLLEADGFVATGHIAHTTVKGKLRNTRDADGQPIFHPGQNVGNSFATGQIDGAPVLYPLNGSIDSASALMFSGQWNQLVYSMRQDITFKLLDQASISDGAGAVTLNLAQQDMVAIRAVMRIGFALPNPVNRMQSNATNRCPISVLTA